MLEEIYLLILRLLLTIISHGIMYLIKRYLDKKPLGMQTILDQAVKDWIKIFVGFNIIKWLFFVKYSYGHYLSLIIVLCHKFTNFAIIIQFVIAVVLRYFYIFHQNVLDHFEDYKIILTTRSLVGIVCLTVTLTEISEAEYRYDYIDLMQKDVDKETLEQNSDNLDITVLLILGLIITIFVQVRIELFKKMVDRFKKRIKSNESW